MWKPSPRHSLRWAVVVASLFLLAILATGCYPSNPMSTFGTSGPIAEMQLNLFYIIFWTAVVVFVLISRCWVSAIVGQLLSKESWWRGPLFEGISNLLVVPPPPVESFSLHLLPLG